MTIKEKFFNILPLLIIANLFALIFYKIKPSEDFLYRYIPLMMLINLALIIVGFFLSIKYLKAQFKSIRKFTWGVIILITVIAFYYRGFVAPMTHRLYFDEDIYLNIAQNIADDGMAELCNRGIPGRCTEGVLNKQPNALPVILSLLFRISGTDERIASLFMIGMSSLSVFLLFLSAYLFFRNEIIALFSALLLALNPISILWAPTITGESVFVFFSIITLMGLGAYQEQRNTPTLIFFLSALAFSVQTRPEAALLAVPFLIFLLTEKVKKMHIYCAIIFLVLISPYVFQINHFKNESWGAPEGNKFGTKYILNNLNVNGSFFFANNRFPVLFTIMALFGIGYSIYKTEYLRLASMILWFTLFFGIYLMFYAGSFDYGVDVRFSQTLILPMFILGGVGGFFLSELASRIIKWKSISVAIIFLLILFSFLPFTEYVSAVTQEAWDARADHDFSMNSTKSLGSNCTIFTHVPSMFLVNGNNALQTWYHSNPRVIDDIFINSDCILFHEGYWCVNYIPYRDTVCKELKETFNLEVFNRINVKDKVYTIYRMRRKSH